MDETRNAHDDDEFEEWWQALRAAMKSKGIREINDAQYVDQIRRGYIPFGSQIDWGFLDMSVDGPTEPESVGGNPSSHTGAFFQQMVDRFNLSGDVVCIGDDFMEFGLIGPIDVVVQFLPDLIQLPQHTYLSAPDGSWVFCHSMEGKENFGFRNAGQAI